MSQDSERARLVGWALLALVLSTLTGCVGMPGPAASAPEHAGDRSVGVTTIVARDSERGRELEVEVWYPAVRPERRATVAYRIKGSGGAIVARLRSPLGAYRNARVDTSDGARPVILLSHGATSSRLAHVSLCEVLASHGYIVAAPDHVGHTMADKLTGVSWDQRARAAMNRPQDLTTVLDELVDRSDDGRSIFEGAVDVDRVAVAGHSFGGRTALGAVGAQFDAPRQIRECAEQPNDRRCNAVPVFGEAPYRYRDDRIKAALLIAPSGFRFYRGDGVAQIDTPTLVVGARQDHTTPYSVHHGPIYRSLQGPRYLLTLERAGHLTATDICDVVDSVGFFADLFGGEEAHDGCGSEFMHPREALELVADVALPFFEAHLGGKDGASLRLQQALARANGTQSEPAPERRLAATP